jgi:HTH-type transcriptional regulator, sugar sensing transcriptional regulator
MDTDLLKLLESSGFTEKEARVYLALLELGKGDVSDIAKSSELKRSIIYVLLEGLIKRGYVSELPNQKINTYQAIDPSVILSQLKTTTKNFSEMLPMLRTLHNKGENRPKITYHETKEGIWNTYQEMNQSKEAFFISSYQRLEKIFPGSIEEWIGLYKKGIIPLQARHLVANNEFDLKVMRKFSEADQKVRYLPEIKEFNMDFTIFKNKLAITSLEDEPFIVVIESEELVRSMKPIFEIAWKNGKEIVTMN